MTTNPRWKDNKKLYPPPEEIAVALQDVGERETLVRKGKEVVRQKFTLLEKLARRIYVSIQKEFPRAEGLTQNTTRGKQPLFKEILLGRRHQDVTETHPFFHRFGRDGKVFIVDNNPETCGIDVSIDHFQEYISQQNHQKSAARTHNDGIRLACALLDPKYRGAVASILSKRKNRAKADISGDPTNHFFEDILVECFLNKSYIAHKPMDEHYAAFPEEDKLKWDPNDHSIMEQNRTTVWLRATWEEYIRPRYKKALDRWNKDTGGGDGSAASFIDYCAGDRWLAWVFCKDIEANFLLASGTAGRMPRHLQLEPGFVDDGLSSLSSSSNLRTQQNEVEDELLESKKTRKRFVATLNKVDDYLMSRKSDQTDSKMDQVAKLSLMMIDEKVLGTMTPNTKGKYISALNRKRKSVMDEVEEDEESD